MEMGIIHSSLLLSLIFSKSIAFGLLQLSLWQLEKEILEAAKVK